MRSAHHKHKLDDFAQKAEAALSDLDVLNGWLIAFGYQAESSKKKALQALRKVYINIFDLVSGKLDQVKKSLKELRVYSKKHARHWKIFPKARAKENEKL